MGIKIETKISIILPTYNGAKSITSSIESVISQSFKDWELIIIDDGSTDKTIQTISQYVKKDSRIILLQNESNLGIQKTLNIGLKKAQGEYIARIDDDDEWIDEDKLRKQVNFLENNKDYSLVGTRAIVCDEKGNELREFLFPESDIEIRNKLLSGNCFVHSSVMFRKKSVMELRGYSEEESVKHIEDYDLWLKLGIISKLHNLPDFTTKYNVKFDNISSKNRIKQALKSIRLSWKYKDKYPNCIYALISSISRLFFCLVLPNMSFSLLKNKIIKFYKKF